MKRLFIVLLITNAVIACMSSCKKDPVFLPVSGGGGSSSPWTIESRADNWVKDSYGSYVSTLKGIISREVNGNQKVKIYLMTEGEERMINQFIFFMSGQLWATSSGNDVKVNFRSGSDKLPFSYLNIKVVIE